MDLVTKIVSSSTFFAGLGSIRFGTIHFKFVELLPLIMRLNDVERMAGSRKIGEAIVWLQPMTMSTI